MCIISEHEQESTNLVTVCQLVRAAAKNAADRVMIP